MFEDDVLSIQRLKSSFVFFWLKDGLSTLVGALIGWVLVEGGVFLAPPCLTAVCSNWGRGRCFYFVYFESLFWRLFSIQFYLFYL